MLWKIQIEGSKWATEEMAGRELGAYLVLLPEWEGWLRMDPFFWASQLQATVALSRSAPHSHPTGKEGSAHLHLVTVEEVDVRFVLLRILAHQEEDGGIAHLIQHRLAVLDCRQREVLQLLLEKKKEEAGQWGSTELLGSLLDERYLTELVLLSRDLLGSSNTRVTVCSGLGLHRTRKEVDGKQNSCSPEFPNMGTQWKT